jgi:lipopolysaccharide/colanic/teichoic acid biosynthesis glycosyltransferase
MGYLLICFIYTIEVPQPTVFNQVLATKADADKTIIALKSMEENTDCKIVNIKIQ